LKTAGVRVQGATRHGLITLPHKVKLIALLVLCAGCQRVPMLPGLTPFKIDVQQGNLVTQEMVTKLKPGMSKAQVRFALGTPLVVDPFHHDRWDYVYVLQKRGRLIEHRRIVVLFDQDKLLRIEGDVVPSEATAAAEAASTPPPKDSPPKDSPPAGATAAPGGGVTPPSPIEGPAPR
jgi:outer membrane protein assembly factor BamE